MDEVCEWIGRSPFYKYIIYNAYFNKTVSIFNSHCYIFSSQPILSSQGLALKFLLCLLPRWYGNLPTIDTYCPRHTGTRSYYAHEDPNSTPICILLYTYIYTNIHFHWKKHDHANELEMVSRSYYALLLSTMLIRRWYYVNAVPTTLVIRQSGSYYVFTRALLGSLAAKLLTCLCMACG